MHTLPKTLKLSFDCLDRAGTPVRAEVTVDPGAHEGRVVWHAVFPGTGEPPAEMLGSSSDVGQVEADIAAKVATLQVGGAVVVPANPQRSR